MGSNAGSSRNVSLRRWLVWFALASIFAVACWLLSQWQLARLAEVKAEIALVSKNYNAVPIVTNDLPKHVNRTSEYLPFALSGRYVAGSTLLVRNQPLNGQPGFEQFAAFQIKSSQVVFINRGWLSTGNSQDEPDLVPALPKGQIALVGRLRLNSPNKIDSAPIGQISHSSAAMAGKKLNLETNSFFKGFYLQLDTENDEAMSIPKHLDAPTADEGNHLSYAFQWVIFALLAFAALGWAIRKEVVANKVRKGLMIKPAKRHSRADVDEAFEDELTQRN
ncbi:MAG: hypothetical protein RL556_731 [Actinomycetota bacterium]